MRSILEIEADESTQRHIEELTRERGGFSEDSFISSIEQSWVRDARESGDITGTQNKSSDSGDGVVASSEYKEEAEPTGSYNNDRTGGWVSIKSGYDGSKYARIRFVDEVELNTFYRVAEQNAAVESNLNYFFMPVTLHSKWITYEKIFDRSSDSGCHSDRQRMLLDIFRHTDQMCRENKQG